MGRDRRLWQVQSRLCCSRQRVVFRYDVCMRDIGRLFLFSAFLGIACASYGQIENHGPLEPLAFLSGRWVSEKGNDFQEETWSPVSRGSMLGTFRVVQSGKPVFYEFWVVEIDNDRAVLKLKHFNAGLAGWEDKDSSTKMPVVSSSKDDVVFAEPDGSVSLHYHRAGATLTCIVHHVKNGKADDETFTLVRTP